MNTRISPRAAGFSLIEVLIAVVVLSFGLLALAALQGSLFKASAEAKMQSVALGLATEKLEYFRGYQSEPDYVAIDSTTTSETIDVGGIGYTREWSVARYASPEVGGEFTSVANTASDIGATYADNNEFKRIVVTVNWTDAQGQPQYVTLEDAIAAIDPGDSRRIAKNAGGARPRGPEVRIYDPTTQQDGVIPIALGDGTETAATNPKPIVNSSNVVETRFDILTYTGGDGTVANSQSRIQTLVVGCTCDYGAKPTATTARGKRPTYWDGMRYVVPEDTDYVPLAGAATSASSTQSAACTVCCRDHHDPSTLKTEAARFDPRNSSHSAGHFLLNGSTLTGPFTAGTYTEVCRVIRVGGFFRVAADTYNDYMNLLDTNSLVVAPVVPDVGKPAFVPHSGATENYQDFVKAYLNARVVAPTSETAYNTVLAATIPTTTDNLETTHSINKVPDTISLQDKITFKPNDPEKWLHLRGLYVDYLEPSALQAITDAKTRCPDSAQKENCVLRVLPFTSINLTELGVWTPQAAPASIVVASNHFGETLGEVEPVRGRVERVAQTTVDEGVNAVATLRRSNSGLTTLVKGIDSTDDSASTPETWTATQPFVVQKGTDDTDGELFKVKLDGSYIFATTNKVYINSAPSAICNAATAADSDTSLGSPPNPYTCSSGTLGSQHVLTVGQYNYQLPDGSSTAALTCKDVTPAPNTGADKTYTPGVTESYPVKTCRNYEVTGVALNGISTDSWAVESGTDGTLKEATRINMGVISKDDKVTISFGLPVDTVQLPVCTYIPNPDGDDATADDLFTVAVPDCL